MDRSNNKTLLQSVPLLPSNQVPIYSHDSVDCHQPLVELSGTDGSLDRLDGSSSMAEKSIGSSLSAHSVNAADLKFAKSCLLICLLISLDLMLLSVNPATFTLEFHATWVSF